MTRFTLCLVVVLLLVAAARAEQQPSSSTFRAKATAVSVSVSVQKGKKPVLGLTPSDFVVLDNGVVQTVESATYEEVPIDVTMVLDVSPSVSGTAEEIRRNASRILALLRPVDRVRVLSFFNRVQEIVPLQPAAAVTTLPPLGAGRGTALRDALNVALIAPADPGRRRLVVAVTDADDNASFAWAAHLLAVARRSDATLYVLEADSPSIPPDPSPLEPVNAVGFFDPMRSLETIAEAARLTGGAYDSPRDVVGAMRRVFDEFRKSYVIAYTPENVAPGGWHDLAVRVKGIDDQGIRARRGYFDGR